MTTRDDDGLIGLLTLFLASGKLDASQVLPALRELAEDSTSPGRVTDLIELVSAPTSRFLRGWRNISRVPGWRRRDVFRGIGAKL